ncbi:Gfo/Idh/MocA family oxidoreductase [Eubacteriales bacterium OttesenSCG-928-N13]|nr:Gfo/Idh/MocA family oxidoreductase [Eubacteriales bacterium OttesenSCG-928-N13]
MQVLRIGMIGFGRVARGHHFRAYQALAKTDAPIKLCAVCDTDLAALAHAGELPAYTDLQQMIERESLDAVDICVPTFLHERLATQCMRAGLHVLCEKPMALDIASCERMIACRDQTNKQLMIAMPLRFYAPYLLMKRLIDEGELGAPRRAYFTRSQAMPTSDWMLDERQSGGLLLDVMIHDLDAAGWLFGWPDALHCDGIPLPGSDAIGSASAQFHYANGRMITLMADWLPYYNKHAVRVGRMDFERGYLYFDLERGVLDVVRANDEPKSHAALLTDPMYQNEIRYFASCALHDEAPLRCPPEDGLHAVQWCNRARKSVIDATI